MLMITKATIIPVKWFELKVGDFVLIANLKCKVTRVPNGSEYGHPPVEFSSKDGIMTNLDKRFSYYYKILDCEEKNLCYTCGKNEVEKDHEICKQCQEDQLP